MPTFRYLGDDERVFPQVSLTVAPGETVELPDNPDPRWFEAVKASKPAPAPED